MSRNRYAALFALSLVACMEPVPVPDVDSEGVDNCVAIVVGHPPPRDVPLMERLAQDFVSCGQSDTQISCTAGATSMEQCFSDVVPVAQGIAAEVRTDAYVTCLSDCD